MIEVGETIGNYRITAKLGEGGMGVVFLAEHPVIGRKVALKAIHPELSRNPEVVSRFMTEAKSVNQIGNEHIVDISDFGTTQGGEFYFIMEFLQGESLADRLRREGLFEPNRALGIAAQVADALGASHDHGIIHRDLKPENIFLVNRSQTKDFVKVLDFGLAKLTQGEQKVSHKTRTGSVMGTPYYMSPEQCEGRAGLDHRADIYSLGVILFEMMTGRVPFGGEGYGEILVKHLTMPPPSARELNPMVTPAHEAVVMTALAKKREARFQTMVEFRAALLDPQGFASGAGPRAPALAAGPPTPSMGLSAVEQQSLLEMGRRVAEDKSAQKLPLPSTFSRHGAGELLDDDLQPPRSRRGLVLGTLAVVVAAVLGGLFALRRPTEHVAAAPPAESAPSTPPPAVAPDSVRISFASDPAGAEVFLKASGARLGTTPFESDVAFGKAPVAFVFKKAQYVDKERSVVPDRSSMLDTTLRPAPEEPAPVAKAPEKAASKPKGRSTSSRRKSQPIDEDEVLRPSGM
jgi:serine/threonine protein kinase